MKPKRILKAPVNNPTNTLALTASLSGQEVTGSTQFRDPAIRRLRYESTLTRRNQSAFSQDINLRAGRLFQPTTTWQSGGINE